MRADDRQTDDRQADDTAQLERWLVAWYPDAYRTAMLVLNDRARAEDAVQDAFLRLWRFRASMPPGERARPWLYRIVVNSCFSLARAERRHDSRRVDLDGVGALADRQSSPETDAEHTLVGRSMQDALSRLPEALRVPLVLYYFAGLSEREIAVAIHRRPGTVKSRLSEGRRRLGEDKAVISWQGEGRADA